MKWVTRERPKIDRIACPWLILRFIDREAEILYVPTAEVLRTAREQAAEPFDVPGVELTHDGPLCSFDAFLKKYRLADLARLALEHGACRGRLRQCVDTIAQRAGTRRLQGPPDPHAQGLVAPRQVGNEQQPARHGHVVFSMLT